MIRVVWDYSRDGTFSFLRDCTPDAKVIIGDARLELAKLPKATFDVLAVDAFSSDSIPLHLLTDEALGIYTNALAQNGVLLIHISNRFMRLEPAIAALARKRGLSALQLIDPRQGALTRASQWVVLARDPATFAKLRVDSAGNLSCRRKARHGPMIMPRSCPISCGDN